MASEPPRSLRLNFPTVAQTRTVASTDASAQLLISNAHYEPMEALTAPNTQAQAQQPEDRKWDKDKWKNEWRTMQGNKKQGFWRQAAQTVKAEMIGNNWVTTVTTPVLTTISESETEWLERVLGTGDSSSTSAVPAM